MYRYIFIDNFNIKQDVLVEGSTWAIANKRFYERYIVKEVIRAWKN